MVIATASEEDVIIVKDSTILIRLILISMVLVMPVIVFLVRRFVMVKIMIVIVMWMKSYDKAVVEYELVK